MKIREVWQFAPVLASCRTPTAAVSETTIAVLRALAVPL